MEEVEDKVRRWLDALAQFDVWDAVCTYYRENEAELVEMNREQLQQCLTSDGRTIYGLGGSPRMLYNTGAFYGGITITTDPDKIEFISTDPKWAQDVPPSPGWDSTMAPLMEWFGISLLGVPETRENEVDNRRNESVSDTLRKCFD